MPANCSGSVNGERASFAERRSSTSSVAALQLDELLDQRESEARAAVLAVGGAVDLPELFEDQRRDSPAAMPMPRSMTVDA